MVTLDRLISVVLLVTQALTHKYIILQYLLCSDYSFANAALNHIHTLGYSPQHKISLKKIYNGYLRRKILHIDQLIFRGKQ